MKLNGQSLRWFACTILSLCSAACGSDEVVSVRSTRDFHATNRKESSGASEPESGSGNADEAIATRPAFRGPRHLVWESAHPVWSAGTVMGTGTGGVSSVAAPSIDVEQLGIEGVWESMLTTLSDDVRSVRRCTLTLSATTVSQTCVVTQTMNAGQPWICGATDKTLRREVKSTYLLGVGENTSLNLVLDDSEVLVDTLCAENAPTDLEDDLSINLDSRNSRVEALRVVGSKPELVYQRQRPSRSR